MNPELIALSAAYGIKLVGLIILTIFAFTVFASINDAFKSFNDANIMEQLRIVATILLLGGAGVYGAILYQRSKSSNVAPSRIAWMSSRNRLLR